MALDNLEIIKTIGVYNRHKFIVTILSLVMAITMNYFWIAFPITPLIILISLSFISGILYLMIVKLGKGLSFSLHLSRMFDSFLVLGIIYWTGGIESFFTPLLFFIIMGTGIVGGLIPSMILTTISSFAYMTIILLEYLGIIPHHHVLPIIGCAYDTSFYTYCLSGLNIAFFYVTALISGYLGKEIKGKTMTMAQISQQEKFSREFLNSILNNMADGLVVIDVDFKVQMTNQAAQEMLGHSEEELKNHPIFEFIQDEDFPILLEKTIKQGQLTSEEIELINPKDHKKEVLTLKMTSLKDISGKVIGVIVVSRDVTEEELMERARANFLSLVTHELRTPLTSIKAYTETLLDGVSNSEEEKEFLEVIDAESNVLIRQINEMLMVTELDVKRIPLRKRMINLSQLVTELIDPTKSVKETLLEKMADEKKIKISINIAKGLPDFRADYTKIKTAIEQLIENAIKFTKPGGQVTVWAEKTDDKIKIWVTDTGIGISEDKIPLIFTQFYQLEEPMTKEAKGIGLGLSLVKHIIQTHGGDIWVESEIGKGSSFFFTLPV
ncbi:MAG: ATP-binding protein [bacterium]|nr:ATP-binding protein [bacterium]